MCYFWQVTFCYDILMSYLNESRGIRQSIINISGSLFASGFAAISLMILSRYLGPTYFGQFSTAFALSLILVRVGDLGLSIATTKLLPGAEDNKKQLLLTLITRYRLALAGIILVLGLIFSQLLPQYLLSENSSLILLAFIVSVATALFEHSQFTLQANHKFLQSAFINFSQGLTKLIVVVIAFLIGSQNLIPVKSLVLLTFLFYMLAPVVPVLLTLMIKPQLLNWKTRISNQFSKEDISAQNIQLWSLIKHASFGIISAGIIENADILFVQSYLDDYQAGLLGGVTRIALLLYIVGYALGNVLNPRVAKYKLKSDLLSFWKKSWLVFVCCVLGFVLSMFITEPLIIYTIGPDYLEALPTLRILLAAGFSTIALMPYIAFFYSFNLSWYFSVSGIIQLIIVLLGNVWLVPSMGIEGAAWTRLFSRLILLIITLFLARQQLQKSISNEIT